MSVWTHVCIIYKYIYLYVNCGTSLGWNTMWLLKRIKQPLRWKDVQDTVLSSVKLRLSTVLRSICIGTWYVTTCVRV